jgi:hypothetical protein
MQLPVVYRVYTMADVNLGDRCYPIYKGLASVL